MTNIFIKEFRVSKNSNIEPTRTRPYIEFTCFHCNTIQTMTKACYKDTSPCRECQKRLRGKTNFFIKAKEKFGDAFDLSKTETEYFDYTTPVTVRCIKHDHEYKVKPVHFVSNPYPNQPHKGGCPKCMEETNKTKNQKPIDFYLKLIEDKFPAAIVTDIPSETPSQIEFLTLTCEFHGSFTKRLRDIHKVNADISTNLCPSCSKEQLAWNTRTARTDIPGLVYFVHFKDVDLYKCGVTYKTTKERLRGHISNIDIKWELPFDTLSDAYSFETQFFREHYKYKCSHPDTTLGGYTEFLTTEIPKPSERFIAEMLCRKKSNSEKLPPDNAEDNSERSLHIAGTCND